MSQSDAPLGLRERKNRRTQLAIVQATTELTVEGGWANATIQRIAERADVSPRTVSTWFPHKDDIVFGDADVLIGRGIAHLTGTEGDVVDRLIAWFEEARDRPDQPDLGRLRNAAIQSDPELRARYRGYFERMQTAFAEAVARDTGAAASDLGPQLLAGAAITFLDQLAAAAFDAANPDLAATKVDTGIAFLRAGLASIQASSR